jgi:hypothetical protein
LFTAFKKRFKATPWDVTYKVEVTEWRAGLWLESLREQNFDDTVRACLFVNHTSAWIPALERSYSTR